MLCCSDDGEDEAEVDLTRWLPDEVLQLVLSAVPALDLVVSARLVCRRWRRLLSDRSVWRRVRLQGRVGRERELCHVLQRVPALHELALFVEDRVPTRCPRLVRDAVARAAAAGLELRSLAVDCRHFAGDPGSFPAILEALQDVLVELDVRLVGVEPVRPASPLRPQPAPAFAALADQANLRRLRLRALFDPCWYFEELRCPRHRLLELDVSECEPYLERLLADLLHAHSPTLRTLRLHARVAARLCPLPGSLPALEHLILDLGHQDAAVTLPADLSQRLGRLTLAKVNRRLPAPDQDEPSQAVRSICCKHWDSLTTLELEDSLLSPADLAAILAVCGLKRVLLRGGCFLGSAATLGAATLGAAAASSKARLLPRGVHFCPRDPDTGLYALALALAPATVNSR